MRFENGMLGLCISMCAIMGMILSGFVLSVDEYDETVTGYEYVTDVSGLFEYTDQPTFIDYNPAANWTGFYTTDPDIFAGVNYTATVDNRANNYPIKQPATQTPGTVTLQSSWTQMTPPYEGGEYPRTWGIVYAATGNIYDYTSADDPSGDYTMNPNVTALSTVVQNITIGDADRIRFDFSGSNGPVVSLQSSWTYQRLFFSTGVSITTHDTYTLNYTETVDHIIIELESSIVRAYSSSGTQLWSGQAQNVAVAYNGESDGGHATVLGSSLSYVLLEDPPATYMDISQGVSLSGSSANWANDYRNGRIDILFRAPSGSSTYGNTYTMPLLDIDGNSTGQTMTLTVSVPSSGNVSVSLSSGSESDTVSLGAWRNFMVSLDFVTGTYEAIPVTDFISFTTYNVLEGSAQSLDVDVSQRCISSMSMSAGRSLTFGVVQTATFLNTYDAVMIDPSLDISDYFTELSDIRLNFFSFALYGDSITINGKTYEVNSNAQIDIPDTSDGEPVDRWFTLTNIYITFEGSNTYLTFVNDSQTIDLGPTTTTEISMNGIWYFTTGLYEGYETVETVYEWDYKSFILDNNTAIAVFLGLLALGTIIGARMIRGGMSLLDYVVVGFSALCAFVLMVV